AVHRAGHRPPRRRDPGGRGGGRPERRVRVRASRRPPVRSARRLPRPGRDAGRRGRAGRGEAPGHVLPGAPGGDAGPRPGGA
ncbi:MAG: hypothetical protein AVDCRST_MAG05-2045, partial [uncultured Rubrobacteraceae bacterium]